MIQKKVCMLGAYAVGKTSLVSRFVKSLFSDKYHTTVGVKVDKKVVAVGEEGAFDGQNGKIKWGPYFGDATRTLTATVRPGLGREGAKVGQAMEGVRGGLRGTVSFDGMNSPVIITR